MSTKEEILNQIINTHYTKERKSDLLVYNMPQKLTHEAALQAMEAYAQQQVQLALEKAAENASMRIKQGDKITKAGQTIFLKDIEITVDKQPILNTKI